MGGCMRKRLRLARGLAFVGAVSVAAAMGCDRKPVPDAETRENTSLGTQPSSASHADDSNPPIEAAADSAAATPAGGDASVDPSSKNSVQPDIEHLTRATRRRINQTRQALRDAPGSSDIPARLGMMYLANGMEKDAIPLFEQALKKAPRHAATWYLLGIARSSQGDEKRAADAFRKAIEFDSVSVFPRMRLATLLLESDKPAAIRELRAAAGMKNTPAFTLLQISEAFDQLGEHDAAVDTCRRALSIAPHCMRARQHLEALLRKHGGDTINLPTVHALGGDGEGCEAPIDTVLLQATALGQPTAAGISQAMARAGGGDFEGALRVLDSILREDPENLGILLASGRVHEARGAGDLAIMAYRDVLASDPGNLQASEELAQVLLDSNQVSKAGEVLESGLRRHPDAIQLLPLQARYLVRADRVEEGIRLYRRLIDLKEGHAAARADLARTLIDLRRFDQAEAEIKLLMGDVEFGATALTLRGIIRQSKGNEEGAEQDWRAAMAGTPSSIESFTRLAVMSSARGDYKTAIDVLRDGFSMHPGDPAIMNALAWMLATTPRADLRNGKEARELATLACGQVHFSSHAFLDTLGAACAEAGEFQLAERAARMAIGLAERNGQDQAARSYRQRSLLYEARKPYHLPE